MVTQINRTSLRTHKTGHHNVSGRDVRKTQEPCHGRKTHSTTSNQRRKNVAFAGNVMWSVRSSFTLITRSRVMLIGTSTYWCLAFVRRTRAYARIRLPPLKCATLALSCCMRLQPRSGTSPWALACSRSVLLNTWLVTIGSCHGLPRILRPAGRDVDPCHSPSTSASGRGWPFAHVSRVSGVEAVHEPHEHLRPLACEMFRAQVRRVHLGGDLLHCEFPAAHRLLEPQVLNLDVLRFVQPCSAHERHCCTGVDVQPNRDGSTQVFGKRLNSHRLCCCTVASVQFCFGGAGGHNALLLRSRFDQMLSCPR